MVEGRLNNAPLVEAIFEMKWELPTSSSNQKVDPNYTLLVGRLFDRVAQKNYSYYEQLPAATIPEEMAAGLIQHRFRVEKDNWPLIQLGPGIITLNETEGYSWPDFQSRTGDLIRTFFDSYPPNNRVCINGLTLRYIDAIEFNFKDQKIMEFLKQKMDIDINLPEKLFDGSRVKNTPLGLDLALSYPCSQPKGAVLIKIARGQKSKKDVLIVETNVRSMGEDALQNPDEIIKWVEEAHVITDGWFEKLFQNLMESFK